MEPSSAPFRPEELLEHAAWIRRLARRLVQGEARADDLVQETWLAALRAAPRGGPLRPWLARVARNFARTYVQLWPPGASFQEPANRPVFVLTDAAGRFEAPGLTPGTYTVRVELEGHAEYARELALEGGREVRHDVDLAGDGSRLDGVVRGRVLSRSGTYSGRVFVVLVPTDDRSGMRDARVEWEEAGGLTEGGFAFEGLQDRDYQLGLMAQDTTPVLPAAVVVRPSEEEHVFEVQDLEPRGTLSFTAADAESGDPLGVFRVDLDFAGGAGGGRALTAEDGALAFEGVRAGDRHRYRVTAAGYQPVWGEEDVADAESLSRSIAVELVPGWGADVTAVDGDGHPLAGVRLHFDGVDVGVTDDAGELRVRLDARPQVVAAECLDWVLAPGGSVLPDTGRFRDHPGWLRLALAPPE